MEEAGCGVVAVGPQAFIILLEFFILEAAMGGWVGGHRLPHDSARDLLALRRAFLGWRYHRPRTHTKGQRQCRSVGPSGPAGLFQ